jgi:hypothetical protein
MPPSRNHPRSPSVLIVPLTSLQVPDALLARSESNLHPSERRLLLLDGSIPVRVLGTYRSSDISHQRTDYECRPSLPSTEQHCMSPRSVPPSRSHIPSTQSPYPTVVRSTQQFGTSQPPTYPTIPQNSRRELTNCNHVSYPAVRPKIPKPQGEVGRPGRGGYTLRTALNWPFSEFNAVKVRTSRALLVYYIH